ncbi:hypothetical protein PPUJ20188_28670 [Pseudomonas putida]|nr:hypothetical protein PPUJ20188_28670 [Pseudomonas putida]
MTTLTRADWEQRAQQLKIEGRAFINGEYTDAASGETFECLSPVDGRFLAKVASCDLADANRAVENARATFNAGVWSQLAPAKRKAKLIRFADLLNILIVYTGWFRVSLASVRSSPGQNSDNACESSVRRCT